VADPALYLHRGCMALLELRGQTDRWTAVAARTLSGAASVRITAAYAIVLVAVYAWLPGLVCLLALGELIWRGKGLVIAFAVGHIGATLIVAAGLVVALEAGWLPFSVARATDVGMSYGAVGVLGALTASIPSRWRTAWAGWWLGIAVTAASVADFNFTAVGHILALLLGIGLSFRLPATADWTPIRAVLLSGGVAFGYFLLSGSSVVATAGGVAGMLIALLAGRVSRSRNPATV